MATCAVLSTEPGRAVPLQRRFCRAGSRRSRPGGALVGGGRSLQTCGTNRRHQRPSAPAFFSFKLNGPQSEPSVLCVMSRSDPNDWLSSDPAGTGVSPVDVLASRDGALVLTPDVGGLGVLLDETSLGALVLLVRAGPPVPGASSGFDPAGGGAKGEKTCFKVHPGVKVHCGFIHLHVSHLELITPSFLLSNFYKAFFSLCFSALIWTRTRTVDPADSLI